MLSIVAVTAHIVGSGYYLSSPGASLLLVVVVAATLLGGRGPFRVAHPPVRAPQAFACASLLAVVFFTLLRNLGS